MQSNNSLPFQILADASAIEIFLSAVFGIVFGMSTTLFAIGIIKPSLIFILLENQFGPEFVNPDYNFTLNLIKSYPNYGELVKTHSEIMKNNIVIPKNIDLKWSTLNNFKHINHLPPTITLNRDLITKVIYRISPKINIINLTEDADHIKLSLSVNKSDMPLRLPPRDAFIEFAIYLLVQIYCQTNEYRDRVRSAQNEKISKERKAKLQTEKNSLQKKFEETAIEEIKLSITNLENKSKGAISSCNAQYKFAKSIHEKTKSEILKKFSHRVISAYEQLVQKQLELNLLNDEIYNKKDTNQLKSKIHHELVYITSLSNTVKSYYREFEKAYIKEPEPSAGATQGENRNLATSATSLSDTHAQRVGFRR